MPEYVTHSILWCEMSFLCTSNTHCANILISKKHKKLDICYIHDSLRCIKHTNVGLVDAMLSFLYVRVGKTLTINLCILYTNIVIQRKLYVLCLTIM